MTTPPESAPASAAPPVPGPATPAVGSAVPEAAGAPEPSAAAGPAPAQSVPAQPAPAAAAPAQSAPAEPASDQSSAPAASDQPAPEQPASDQPVPDQSVPDQSVLDQSVRDQSASHQSGTYPSAPALSGPLPPPPAGLPTPAFGLPPTQPAPPTYDPTRMMPAMPISALYVPVPTPTEPQNGGSKVTVTVLSILLGLFVLASGTLGVLYVRQGQESTRKSEEIAALEATAAQVQRELDATERGLRRTEEDLADLQAERDALAGCLTAIFNFFDAVAAAEGEETPQTQAAEREASLACRGVERYL